MSMYRAGQRLRITESGELVTIWSDAHLPGCYWAHLLTAVGDDTGRPPLVLIRVRNTRANPHPVVTLVEDQ